MFFLVGVVVVGTFWQGVKTGDWYYRERKPIIQIRKYGIACTGNTYVL
jgi:hypothetical protein